MDCYEKRIVYFGKDPKYPESYTGASSGMGLEFARQLAAKGYALALLSNREEELAAAAAGIRERFAVSVDTLCIDLS
ncbi:MAG: SDR family NAD(P)-dependent oxidoreductase, partial [Paludibacteraceae bacterium]|nr:SDR family NAD(P)-dependent oxidoreductase [Paludibacteraceae bacterium]